MSFDWFVRCRKQWIVHFTINHSSSACSEHKRFRGTMLPSIETTLMACLAGVGGFIFFKLIQPKEQESSKESQFPQNTLSSTATVWIGCSVRITQHDTLVGKSGVVVSANDDMWIIVLDEDETSVSLYPKSFIILEDEETRLRRALKEKDRATIKSIMKSREQREINSSLMSDEKNTASFSSNTFSCPVCRNLLFKPCVNSCGHAFCFWCLHRAMNGIGSSACPICRTPFDRLAEPLELLHRFLVRAFPEETSQRETEMEAQMAAYGSARAPAIPLEREDNVKHLVGPVDVVDLFCVSCHNLVKDPVVPVCGHVGCLECLSTSKSCQCSHCSTPILYSQGTEENFKVCSLLLPLLKLANEVDKETVHELAKKVYRPTNGKSEQPTVVELPEINQNSKDSFIHFFLGCDGCGQYPVKGVVFRCLDCPELIGFDLCKSCFERGVHLQERTSYGRFDQSHKPSHRFQERPQTSTALHELMVLHPEMTPAQIMQFVGFHTPEDAEESGSASR
eukprot:scaffold2644_cov129-Cylindrotheca_fusiformis.AAC.2